MPQLSRQGKEPQADISLEYHNNVVALDFRSVDALEWANSIVPIEESWRWIGSTRLVVDMGNATSVLDEALGAGFTVEA